MAQMTVKFSSFCAILLKLNLYSSKFGGVDFIDFNTVHFQIFKSLTSILIFDSFQVILFTIVQMQ